MCDCFLRKPNDDELISTNEQMFKAQMDDLMKKRDAQKVSRGIKKNKVWKFKDPFDQSEIYQRYPEEKDFNEPSNSPKCNISESE